MGDLATVESKPGASILYLMDFAEVFGFYFSGLNGLEYAGVEKCHRVASQYPASPLERL